MKSKTRALTGVLTCTLAASLLAGCASGAPGGGGAPVAKIQLSIPDPLTSSVGVSAQHFADQVKKTSNGSVVVTVVPNGTSFSGDQNAAVTRLQGGSLDALILSTSVYASVVPEMNAISIPYLLDTSLNCSSPAADGSLAVIPLLVSSASCFSDCSLS